MWQHRPVNRTEPSCQTREREADQEHHVLPRSLLIFLCKFYYRGCKCIKGQSAVVSAHAVMIGAAAEAEQTAGLRAASVTLHSK